MKFVRNIWLDNLRKNHILTKFLRLLKKIKVFFPPVDGNWGTWSIFGPCSVTCGEGVHERTRSCNDPAPSLNGKPCDGEDTNSISCNRAECPGKTSFTFFSI